jgi:membrane-bound lytic murein transglycosylase F
MKTAQVLIQRKPEDWRTKRSKVWKKEIITEPEELIGKTVHVWGNSSYQRRLLHLQEELGDTIFIKHLDGDVIPEEVIGMVSDGIIDYTVTDKNVALINQRFYPNIDAEVEVSVKQRIGFGVRNTSTHLKDTLDQWLKEFQKTTTFRYIKHKYLKLSTLPSKSRNEFSSIGGGKISPFDDIIKDVAKESNWDWRFLAALIYQESKFVDNKESWAGAYGLMQFMPHVGPEYGVHPDSPPKIQIKGGMKKILKNYDDWTKIEDSIQRLKFTIASYNAGLGHIQDAQRLAEKYEYNPNLWDNNVEEMVLKLSKPKYYLDDVVKYGYLRGLETYAYVRQIFIRYNEYRRSFDE